VYHHNKGLTVSNVERVLVLWIRAKARIGKVVRAEVVWIKATQIRCREDEVTARASRVQIDCHALRRSGRVCKRVRIVMVRG
jgi:hypothetical protein